MYELDMPPALSDHYSGSYQRGRQLDVLFHIGFTWMPVSRLPT
jgi:hypothetical protein